MLGAVEALSVLPVQLSIKVEPSCLKADRQGCMLQRHATIAYETEDTILKSEHHSAQD